MPRNAFVDPDTVQLPLSEGDWIEVKQRLTYGEQQRLSSASLTSVRIQAGRTDDTEIKLDMQRHAIERIFVWVTEWSFRDKSGKAVKVTRQAIENLREDVADEINTALDEYIEKINAGIDPEGNVMEAAGVIQIDSPKRATKSS